MYIKNNTIVNCSFCGKNKNQVNRLIAGNNAFICNECTLLCEEIMKNDNKSVTGMDMNSIPKPKAIYDMLDEYVIGQRHAKRVLSVAVYNHYKDILGKSEDGDNSGVEISKSNVLMIGSTGCGKTLLAQTLARFLNVPFAIADATTLTESGYVGDDVESVVLKLLQSANFDVNKAQLGIIYIDEIDKISRKGSSSSSGRDISGEGVQQCLLKLVEGTKASVPQGSGRKNPNQENIIVDTTKILFICGGAFDGLENIIKERTTHQGMGFGANILDKSEIKVDELIAKVENNDLIKYGLIPEFIGRFPIITTLDDMTEETLINILTTPKNAIIKQYEKLFAIDGIAFEATDEVLSCIAQQAMKRKSGARGLRAIMESTLLDSMFDVHEFAEIKKVVLAKKDDDNMVVISYDGKGNEINRNIETFIPSSSSNETTKKPQHMIANKV